MKTTFTLQEKRAIFGLAAVLGVRMLGFAIVLPVFSTYANSLPGATPLLAGLAFGAYGLSQALLQIPFGTWSDRHGRRVVVSTGYGLFIVGCVLAALAPNIWVLTLAFFLQGCSAVASAIFAWVADTTNPSRRNFAMAILGMAIGASIVVGFSISAPLAASWGVPFIFWLCAGLSLVAVLIVASMEEPTITGSHAAMRVARGEERPAPAGPANDLSVAHALAVLNAGGFLMMFTMRAVFYTVPLALAGIYHMPTSHQSRLYMIQGILGAICMMIGSRLSDRGHARSMILTSLGLTAVAYGFLGYLGTLTGTLVGYALFFAGFSVLETLLPAAVSKLAAARARGQTMGWFNTSQYLGTFFGSLAAGALVHRPSILYTLLLGLTVACMAGCTLLRRIDIPPHTAEEEEEAPHLEAL